MAVFLQDYNRQGGNSFGVRLENASSGGVPSPWHMAARAVPALRTQLAGGRGRWEGEAAGELGFALCSGEQRMRFAVAEELVVVTSCLEHLHAAFGSC